MHDKYEAMYSRARVEQTSSRDWYKWYDNHNFLAFYNIKHRLIINSQIKNMRFNDNLSVIFKLNKRDLNYILFTVTL